MASDNSNVTYVDFHAKRILPAPEPNDLDAILREGFNRYLVKYDGQPIDGEMIFNLCKDICIDALKTMRQN